MTAADLDAVMRLEQGTAEAPHWGRQAYENLLGGSGPVAQWAFVAEANGEVLGFIAAQIVADVGELESIVVETSARRTSIGSQLLITVTKCVQEQGASRLILEVRAGNAAAIGFYEKAGFCKDGRRPGYYRNPEEDAVLMSRML
jgi:ribosomal-protein-alanine N-acetyltransferase